MSGPLEQSLLYAATDEFGSRLGGFDSGLDGHGARVSGPPAPYSGVGFWYRPEPQEVFFHHHSSQLNHPTSVTEQAVPVKHRRTRSGCFTCRSRRVKCDETRPVCDRCRKGNRECVFPQATSASKRMKEDAAPDPGATASHDHRFGAATLEAIQDDSEDEDPTSPQDVITRPGVSRLQTSTMSRKQKYRQDSIASHAEPSPTPSDPESTTSRTHPSPSQDRSPPPRALAARWSHLKQNEQDLFQFQLGHMTRYHYFLRLDPTDFVHVRLIDLALGFEPLFHAVLALISYHREMQAANGEFKEFWKYYCRSIVQLRRWLESHTERHDAVLLTVLQLAAFEEYLGDWPSLMCHHRAAYSILVSLYTADTIMSTETSRIIFDWIGRLDILASMMAGADTILQRPWFVAALSWSQDRYQLNDVDPQRAIEYFSANLRLIGFDMASAFANAPHTADYTATAATISERMDRIRLEMQALHDTAGAMTDVARTDSADGERSPEAFDARVPLFGGDLWPLNFVWLDWYGGQQMHLYQTAKILHDRAQSDSGGVLTLPHGTLSPAVENLSSSSLLPSSPTSPSQAPTSKAGMAGHVAEQLTQLSTVQCHIYEGIERRSMAPNGAVLGCHIGMGFSTVFLRREPGFIMWARKKLANVERMGYVWPATFRTSMALLWNAPEVVEWWLPDGSGLGKPPLIDEIRAVVEDRNRDPSETGVAGVATGAGSGLEKDQTRIDLRDLRALFDNLDLGLPTRLRHQDVHAADGEHAGSPRPDL